MKEEIEIVRIVMENKEKYLIEIRTVEEMVSGRFHYLKIRRILSQTSFNLYLHNQWTDFHKPSCTWMLQMRAICTYTGCTKVTIDYWDIRPSVTTSFIGYYLRND